EDATAAVAARTRTYSHGNADRVREDPQILQILGEISAVAATSAALVEQVAGSIEAAVAATRRGSEEARAAAVDAELASGRAQIITSRLVPDAATRLFDTLGASAAREGSAPDRHWRNARTVASHNPRVAKAREIGACEVNDTLRGVQWWIGTGTTPSREGRTESGPVPVGA